MKLVAYEVRDDEKPFFDEAANAHQIEIICYPHVLDEETIHFAAGCDGVSILGHSNIYAAILDRLAAMGIRSLSTRTIGCNHIDRAHAKQVGVQVSHSHYDPDGVADFTIMLILMAIRHYKQALFRGNINDYSLRGLRGRELHALTVGVIGCGQIGTRVIDHLRGFGSRILAYTPRPTPELAEKATLVDLETLYRESDVITLHTALNSKTYHLINDDAIRKMKDGVVLINCARGELMDIEAIIAGIESEKIGALGLDVIENEEGIYHEDRSRDILVNRQMAYIRQFPNVTMTQHMAFYTAEAVASMVRISVQNLVASLTHPNDGK